MEYILKEGNYSLHETDEVINKNLLNFEIVKGKFFANNLDKEVNYDNNILNKSHEKIECNEYLIIPTNMRIIICNISSTNHKITEIIAIDYMNISNIEIDRKFQIHLRTYDDYDICMVPINIKEEKSIEELVNYIIQNVDKKNIVDKRIKDTTVAYLLAGFLALLLIITGLLEIL